MDNLSKILSGLAYFHLFVSPWGIRLLMNCIFCGWFAGSIVVASKSVPDDGSLYPLWWCTFVYSMHYSLDGLEL